MKVKKTIRCGNKKAEFYLETSGAEGHTDYSGFGPHGKARRAQNRENRRQNRAECWNAFRELE
jgi:hypothetical protein